MQTPKKISAFLSGLVRVVAAAISLVILIALFPAEAMAADTPTFAFVLSIDGKDTKRAEPGDIITVQVKLRRTDKSEPFTMHALQAEIRYDSSFFEPVPDGTTTNGGINTSDVLGASAPYRELYMNYLSFGGGENWYPEVNLGSFQLRVIATAGASTLVNTDFLVSLPDGSGSYPCTSNTITVTLYKSQTVRYCIEEGKTETVVVEKGSLLTKPSDPQKDGVLFAGWYTDPAYTHPWQFNTDRVNADTTLYAKWSALPGTNPVTDPATDPTTDPATDPTTDPVTDPVTDPTTDPTTDPSPQPEVSLQGYLIGALLLLLLIVIVILVLLLVEKKKRHTEE